MDIKSFEGMPTYTLATVQRPAVLSKVLSVRPADTTGLTLVLEHTQIDVSREFAKRWMPVAGGYFIQYLDGERSFCTSLEFKQSWQPTGVTYHQMRDLSRPERCLLAEAAGVNGVGVRLHWLHSGQSYANLDAWLNAEGVPATVPSTTPPLHSLPQSALLALWPFYPKLVAQYRELLSGVDTWACQRDFGATATPEYLRWLLTQLERPDSGLSTTKKQRWLGYVEGILTAAGLIGDAEISYLREISR